MYSGRGSSTLESQKVSKLTEYKESDPGDVCYTQLCANSGDRKLY